MPNKNKNVAENPSANEGLNEGHGFAMAAYRGALPPPSMMAAFRDIDPNLPERITRMAEMSLECKKAEIDNDRFETESARAIKEMEIKSRDKDLVFKNWIFLIGQIFSFIICVSLIVIGVVLNRIEIILLGSAPIVVACIKNFTPKK